MASPSSEVTSLLKVLARANYYMQSDKNFTQEEWADYIDTKKKIMDAIGGGEL